MPKFAVGGLLAPNFVERGSAPKFVGLQLSAKPLRTAKAVSPLGTLPAGIGEVDVGILQQLVEHGIVLKLCTSKSIFCIIMFPFKTDQNRYALMESQQLSMFTCQIPSGVTIF